MTAIVIQEVMFLIHTSGNKCLISKRTIYIILVQKSRFVLYYEYEIRFQSHLLNKVMQYNVMGYNLTCKASEFV